MFDITTLIQTAGYIGTAGIVFAESGLFFGFFLPGDSLLFTAGILASQGFFEIWILVPLLFISAVAGDSVGYSFGYRLGPKLFMRPNSKLFKKEHLIKANTFFEKHGKKTIILARFVPVVRTFAPILAGAAKMHYRTFLAYNVIGGFLWAVGLTVLGYYLGGVIPNIDRYLLPILAVIIVASISPGIKAIISQYLSSRKK
jgi:membrane-associated protein